jgi:hypothetical protein
MRTITNKMEEADDTGEGCGLQVHIMNAGPIRTLEQNIYPSLSYVTETK